MSHPHGVAKRVTFGSLENVEPKVISDDVINYVYDKSCHAGRSLNIGVKKFLFYYFYTYIYVNTTEVTVTGLSPVEQRTTILQHLIDRQLVDLPTDDQLAKLYDNYKISKELTKEKFDEMWLLFRKNKSSIQRTKCSKLFLLISRISFYLQSFHFCCMYASKPLEYF